MLFKKTSKDKVKEFWNWFARNNHQYLFLSDVDDDEKNAMMEKFLERLHQYCEHLYFEIGAHPKDDKVDLIITADGIIEYFEKVEELVDAAPDIPGWQILKFRQPHGPGFTADYGDKVFDPEEIIFIPLYNEDMPDAIAIRVCYPDYAEDEKNTFISGTYITLDSLIGEKSAVMDIDYLDVVMTPEEISPDDYPRLSSIGQYIRERKHFKYPGEKFDIIERTDDEGYLTFITANFAYKGFRYKNLFPWFLKIMVKIKQYNENGHPEEEEAEVLNSFENFLEGKMKESCIVHYIGRSTLYKKRAVFFYLDNPETVKDTLQSIADSPDAMRSFQFEIEKDPEWHRVEYILASPQPQE
jgi:hypothetical protein